ncbi:MAG: hypothetical protein U9Q23_01955 [Candidatus Bipolaricaulota bacterium]|nr:hypothetical protein [Candidatus Bipolaricaulota bacterium]
MKKCPQGRRASRYHIAPFRVVDDFPILWGKFEEDDLWEQLGRDRLYSQPAERNYCVTDGGIWPFLIEKINRRVEEGLATENPLCPAYYNHRVLPWGDARLR